MEKTKRRLWLYHSVDLAARVVVVCASMGMILLTARVWGLDDKSSSTLVWLAFALSQSAARGPAERLALAICRRVGLSQDSYVARWLERIESSVPLAPDPPPIDSKCQASGAKRALTWMIVFLTIASMGVAVASWFQHEWISLAAGTVCTLLLPLAGVVLWRRRSILEVNERGLCSRLSDGLVPWESIASGWVSEQRGVDGTVEAEWLCLQDTEGQRVWATPIKCLPLEVRADLFAWLRARANLREAGA